MCYGILVKQIMKQTILLSLACLLGTPTVSAQPRYDMQHICREKLNRGVVAIKSNGKVTVSWRLLKADLADTPFDVYRNGKKLNSKPIADGESEGKDGKGIFPVTAEFTADLHSLGQMIQQGQRNIFETSRKITGFR